jgi:hypothetical protein
VFLVVVPGFEAYGASSNGDGGQVLPKSFDC